MRDWIGGIATWLSQGINCALLSGCPDMTVSARCYINRDRPRWRTGYRIINRVFFWQKDHCKSSFRSDVVYALSVLTEHNGDKIMTDNPNVGQS
ncbi:hypothetical protein [Marinobacter salarius]|uniref:hypothetical protein n=1 Tax=Marinobacter salarius TaxID=1420917 RepID=UPI003D0F256D